MRTTRKFYIASSFFVIAGLVYSPISYSEPAGEFSFTTGFDYSSGDYGDETDTDISAIPLVAKYQSDRWTFKATIPYIQIKGPGDVIPSIGPVTQTPRRERTTESGWGDTTVSGTYSFYPTIAQGLVIDLTGKVKFDTSDEDRGLGTGENDYAVQMDVYKVFGKFTAIAGVGYRVYGNPEFATLDNVFYGSVGGAYKLSDKTSIGAIYDYRPKIVDTGSEVSEVLSFVSHKLNDQLKLQAYFVKGFSNGSPDYGGGAMLGYTF